ncbi:MAG: hypothetical protein HYZ53_14015 [Planctomycetes bacterium]|nr:hypothetical protein [Planctomycetota bacterium]
MPTAPALRARSAMIVAQDPSVKRNGRVLLAKVDIPEEVLAPGPRGYRVHVIDYDASTRRHYRPGPPELDCARFEAAARNGLLDDPHLHALNAYAVVMRTLSRFEFALGRRVSWGFGGHQLVVAPHAFADANAFYSRQDQALLFGYFPGHSQGRGRSRKLVYTCLSHDIVAHETTHALVDGLRRRYSDPSSPDQAAFHEGFADIVALLSVFALPGVVEALLPAAPTRDGIPRGSIPLAEFTPRRLRETALFGLADQMGQELLQARGGALRQSARMKPDAGYLERREFEEPHRRGEVLVAAMMNVFLEVWAKRLKEGQGEGTPRCVERSRAAEEGAAVADSLLTSAIRALDYAPPVDLCFSDYLSALLTGDQEVRPDDSRYGLRERLLAGFAAYGICPSSRPSGGGTGTWAPAPPRLDYDRTHFESMQRDPDEVFRFLWENRKALGLYENAYSRVLSVRPCVRTSPDGFPLRETVSEYVQILGVRGEELKRHGIRKPPELDASQQVTIYGGGTLIFDERGRLKFHVAKPIQDFEAQSARLAYLEQHGELRKGSTASRRFSRLHRRRAGALGNFTSEEW